MPWVEQPLQVPTHRDTHLSPNLKGPTLDMITNLHNTTEITIMITGSHRGSLTQGLMKDTTRRTHVSMKAAARLMIQINVLEHYLSLVQDPPPKMTTEE